MLPDGNTPLTARDLARITGFHESYINGHLASSDINISSLRSIDDGRIVARGNRGSNYILYGVDSGAKGRRIYWGEFTAITRLMNRRSENYHPEIDDNGARVFFPRFTIEE